MYGKSYKTLEQTGELDVVVEDAYCQLGELCEELSSWMEGMQGTNLENSDKYSLLDDGVSAMQNHETSPEVPEFLNGLTVHYPVGLPRAKKQSPSRVARLGNLVNMLEGSISALEDKKIELEEEKVEKEKDKDKSVSEVADHLDLLEELITGLQETIDEVSDIEIPSMYG